MLENEQHTDSTIDYVKMESHRRLMDIMHRFYAEKVHSDKDVLNPYEFMDRLALHLVETVPGFRKTPEIKQYPVRECAGIGEVSVPS